MELELEGFTTQAIDTLNRHVHPLWRVTTDGSLRNGGIELITNGGFGGEHLAGAFDRLASGLERVNYDASFRCSTHMHVNMLDFTVNQVARFLLVYTACEPVLFGFCGAYRKSSNFCTPVTESLPFHRKLISKLYDNAVASRSAIQSVNKYTALNLAPLFPSDRSPALGTVEFRGGRPLTTAPEMFQQANLLLAIKEYVRSFTGTEEEMLIAMAAGLNTTVYHTGINAGIEVSESDLENALVQAWCLLKSYQEGLEYQKKNKGKHSAYLDEMDHAAPTRPRARAFNAQPYSTWNGSMPGGEAPTRSASLTQSDGLQGPNFTTMGELEATISRSAFPRFYSNIPSLTTSDVQLKSDAAYSTLLSNPEINREDAITLVVNWIGDWRDGEHANKLLSAVAMLAGRSHEAIATGQLTDPERHRFIRSRLGVRFDIDSRIGKPANYRKMLSATRWREVCSVYGRDPTDTDNRALWGDLIMSTVRIKNRTSLIRLCEQNHCGQSSVALAAGTSFTTVKAFALFRALNVASSDYIHADSLDRYDGVARIMQILMETRCAVPIMISAPDGSRRCKFFTATGMMGSGDARTTQTQTHEPREVHRDALVYQVH